MLISTLPLLTCPKPQRGGNVCAGSLSYAGASKGEISSGFVKCGHCKSEYPILAGVLVLVHKPGDYLCLHAKGVSEWVSDQDIPSQYRKSYLAAKREIQIEHIEDDLEANRVNALYYMNHYLNVKNAESPWWRAEGEETSPVIESLIKEYWDRGPFSEIEKWASNKKLKNVVELGCGVGGLYRKLKNRCEFYLGVDQSFSSIALARYLNMNVGKTKTIQIPQDLLNGSLSRKPNVLRLNDQSGNVDFVVSDFNTCPIANNLWDAVFSLNTIDMLEDPSALPRVQKKLLKPNGKAVVSSPYIWHEHVARELRSQLPRNISNSPLHSSQAIEWLYQSNGFEIESSLNHVPWLFFKHLRQLEIYSVHLFIGSLSGP